MKQFFLALFMVSFSILFIGCNNQKTTQAPLAGKEKTVAQVNEQTPQPIVEKSSEQSPVVERKITEIYDLQERCGKSSEEYFRNRLKEEGSYTCHYNRKLNKCFLNSFTSSGEKLMDIQENKIYGKCSYSGASCYFYDNENMIRNEWEKLIKTFMEE